MLHWKNAQKKPKGKELKIMQALVEISVTLFQLLDVISRRTLDSVGWASIWFILTSMEQQGFSCFNKFLWTSPNRRKKKKKKLNGEPRPLFTTAKKRERSTEGICFNDENGVVPGVQYSSSLNHSKTNLIHMKDSFLFVNNSLLHFTSIY